MISKIEVSCVHCNIGNDLRKYTIKKIGSLDKYMSKHSRRSAHAEVKLKEAKAKDKKQCTCEVILYLPNETITAKETTINMFAAVDIVEAKLKNSIKKNKEKHSSPHVARRLLNKLKRKTA